MEAAAVPENAGHEGELDPIPLEIVLLLAKIGLNSVTIGQASADERRDKAIVAAGVRARLAELIKSHPREFDEAMAAVKAACWRMVNEVVKP